MIQNITTALSPQSDQAPARNSLQDRTGGSSQAPVKAPSTDEKQAPDEFHEVDISSEVVERVYDISEVATVLIQTGADVISEAGLKGALSTAAKLGSAGAGAFFACKGVRDVKQGIVNKKPVQVMTGVGELGLAGEAGIATAQSIAQLPSVAKAIGSSAASVICSPALKVAGTTFGFVYAATELMEGIHLISKGIQHKDREEIALGVLNVGLGVAAASLFATGGVPAALALGGLSVLELGAFSSGQVRDAVRSWEDRDRQAEVETAKPLATADLSQFVISD